MPKEIRTLDPELLLRHVPGQLGQWRLYLERVHGVPPGGAQLAQSHAPLYRVLRVALVPGALVLALPLLLAGLGRADVLAIADARIGNEPAVADATGARPEHPAVITRPPIRARLPTLTPAGPPPSPGTGDHRQ